MSRKAKKTADFIVPLCINGLNGRMLRLPAKKLKQREVLLVYGHHASLERFIGMAEALNDFGGVTMPDMPGFGGMDSFYKIGEKPSLDNFADYLAAFIKLRYRSRRFTVIAVSFGFTIVTRMLQKHPDMAKKVDLLVSIIGFTRHDEFTFSRPRYWSYRLAAGVFRRRLPATFFRNIILHPAIISSFYSRTHNAKRKFAQLTPEEHKAAADFETRLWRANDLRTHMDTSVTMLTVDNCQLKVDLPVWHVSVKDDNYFDTHIVEQHMRVIFTDYNEIPIKLTSHSLVALTDKKQAKSLLPARLRALLRAAP